VLTRRLGDLSEGGDERLKNMEQVDLTPQNVPEQLRISANGPLVQDRPSILDLLNQTYQVDPSVGKIHRLIWTNGSLTEKTVAECADQDEKVLYKEKFNVLEGDQLWLHLRQEHHDTTLAGHPGRAKTFDLLDRQYY